MKTVYWLCFFACLHVLPINALSLIEFYDRAFSKSPALDTKQQTLENTQDAIDLVRAKSYPTLDLTASGTKSSQKQDNVADKSLYNSASGISLNYSFVALHDEQVQIKELEHQNSAIDLESSKKSFGIKLIKAYLTASKIQSTIKQLLAQKKWLINKVTQAETEDRLGGGNKMNLYTLGTQLASVHDQIKAQESVYIGAINELVELYGGYVGDVHRLNVNRIESIFDPSMIALEQLINAALMHDQSVQSAYNQIKINNLSIQIGKNANIPSLSVFGRFQRTGSDISTISSGWITTPSSSSTINNLSFGWNLSWSIYDQGVLKNAVNNLLVQKLQLNNQLLIAQRLVKKKAHQTYHDLLLLGDRLELIKDGIDNANNVLKIREAQHRFDSVNTDGLLSAQEQLVKFENSLLNIHVEHIQKQLDLKVLMSNFSRNDALTINNWLDDKPKHLDYYQAVDEKFNVFKAQFTPPKRPSHNPLTHQNLPPNPAPIIAPVSQKNPNTELKSQAEEVFYTTHLAAQAETIDQSANQVLITPNTPKELIDVEFEHPDQDQALDADDPDQAVYHYFHEYLNAADQPIDLEPTPTPP